MKLLAQLPFQNLSQTPQIVRDFLSGNLSGYDAQRFVAENVRQAAKARTQQFSEEKRQNLVEILLRQMVNPSPAQRESLRLLSEKNSVTVTTGHQLNLFSGPVFFFYKIIQTIATAQELSGQHPGYHFLPVFWMATEDHDLEEIEFFRTRENRYSIREKSGPAVGRIQLSDLSFIENFARDFSGYPFAEELVSLMKQAYRAGSTLAEATRAFVQHFFGEEGLLVIDGDDPALKKQMTEIFQEELQNSELQRHTAEMVGEFLKKYGKVQVNPRDVNLFYLDKNRHRIDRGQKFYLQSSLKTFSSEEMLAEVTNHPEKFSPNALLRPVYQETVLPNILYIGGNAEIAYWLELKAYFTFLQLPYPILLPRQSLIWLTPKQNKKLEKLGLTPEEIVLNPKNTADARLMQESSLSPTLAGLEKQLQNSYLQLKNQAAETDVTFGNLVQAEARRMEKSFHRMAHRLMKAERKKHADKINRILGLAEEINPNGAWQERVWNFSVFYAEYGPAWLRGCYSLLGPSEAPGLLLAEI